MPAQVYELTDSGVVESVEELEDGGLRVALAGEESVQLEAGALGLDSEIVPVGDLLLVGSTGSSTTYVTLRERDECYVLNEPAIDDGTHMIFDFGLRLPKSPDFDPGSVDDHRLNIPKCVGGPYAALLAIKLVDRYVAQGICHRLFVGGIAIRCNATWLVCLG